MGERAGINKRRGTSLSAKIIRGITIPVILVFLLAGILILNTVKTSVNRLSETEMVTKSQSAAYQVGGFINSFLAQTEQIASNMAYEQILLEAKKGTKIDQLTDYEFVKEGLVKSSNTDKENILAVWIGDFDSSQIVHSDGFLVEDGWDITERPWYKVRETKQPLLVPPYIDDSTGKLVVTIAAPITLQETGEVIGAAGIDITLDHLNTIMKEYKIGNDGKFLLSDSEGMVVYYTDESLINKNVKDIGFSENMVHNILNNNIVFTKCKVNGVKNCGYVSMVADTNWNVVSLLPESEFGSTLSRIIMMVISIFVIGILIVIIVIRIIASSVVKPLKKLTIVSEQIAAGDLDVSIMAATKDEIGALGQAMTATVVRLKDYITYIDEISVVLDLIADGNLRFDLKCEYAGEFSKLKTGLLNIQDKLTTALSNINHVSVQVADGANQISRVAISLANASMEQSASIEKLSQSIESVRKLTESNMKNAESANGSAQIAGVYLENGNKEMEQLMDTMKEISESSKKINGILESIDDIASQTNLLSINASIEAARAGELGKGFSVVANEVGHLANQSTVSAKESGDLINVILAAIEKGNKKSGEASKTMLDVLDNAKEASLKIAGICNSVTIETDAIRIVSEEVEQITNIIEHNMAASEESVATSEELATQAEVLKKLVEEFKI